MPRLDKVEKLALALIFSCKSLNNWAPSFENKPINNFMLEYDRLNRGRNYYNSRSLYYITIDALDDETLRIKPKYDLNDAKTLINKITKKYLLAVAKHVIVIPLKKAKLGKDIKFGSFEIITGSKDKIVKKISALINLNEFETEQRISHTIRSRSENFLDYPLLVIKMNTLTSNLERLSNSYAHWLTCIINIIFYAYIFPKHINIFASAKEYFFKSEHIAIYSKNIDGCFHIPMQYKSTCVCNLEWLRNKKYQNLFIKLFKVLVVNRFNEELNSNFLQATIHLDKSLENGNSMDESLNVPILFIVIAAEILLLGNSNFEKRLRLAVILPRISDTKKGQIKNYTKIVNDIYQLRSNYVHSGKIEENYLQNYETINKKIIIVRKMLCKLICKSYLFTIKFRKNNSEDSASINKWYLYLDTIWKKAIGLI